MSMKLIVTGMVLLAGCALPGSDVDGESEALNIAVRDPFGGLELPAARATNVIHVTVDATSLSKTERAAVRSLTVRVKGGRVPVNQLYPIGDQLLDGETRFHTYPIATELADGETGFAYYPSIDHGVVVFRIGVNDANGTELVWAQERIGVNDHNGSELAWTDRVVIVLPAPKAKSKT